MATRFPDEYRRMLVRLRAARETAGLSQVEVAAQIGMPQPYISKVETGERRLDPFELRELAQVCGSTVIELMGLEDGD